MFNIQDLKDASSVIKNKEIEKNVILKNLGDKKSLIAKFNLSKNSNGLCYIRVSVGILEDQGLYDSFTHVIFEDYSKNIANKKIRMTEKNIYDFWNESITDEMLKPHYDAIKDQYSL